MDPVQNPLKQKRKKQIRREDRPLSVSAESTFRSLAQSLSDQIEEETFRRKYAPAASVLKLVGAGVFLAASVAVPNLPRALHPFLSDKKDYLVWKRFNIPYLKRTLERLENQKLIRVTERNAVQAVELTDRGKQKLLKCTLDSLMLKKPKHWDGRWRLISYDIPKHSHSVGTIFRNYLFAWKFYPLHKSVFLHAYPCEAEIGWLRDYLGIGKHVRMFTVETIENDGSFKEFFGLSE